MNRKLEHIDRSNFTLSVLNGHRGDLVRGLAKLDPGVNASILLHEDPPRASLFGIPLSVDVRPIATEGVISHLELAFRTDKVMVWVLRITEGGGLEEPGDEDPFGGVDDEPAKVFREIVARLGAALLSSDVLAPSRLGPILDPN